MCVMYEVCIVLFFDVVGIIVYFYCVFGYVVCVVVSVEFDEWC